MSEPSSQTQKGANRRSICLLLLITTIIIVNLLQWRWMTKYRIWDLPPSWDAAMYHARALQYSNVIRENGWAGFSEEFKNPSQARPPLLAISTLAFYPAGPYHLEFGHIIVLLYVALLVIMTYFIAELLSDPYGGLFSGLYLLFFPSIMSYSKEFLSDLPACAFLSLSMYCLLRSRDFRLIRWNIMMGVGIALAMYARNFAGIYILFPLIYTLFRGWRAMKWSALARLLPGVIAAILILYPWYMHHLSTLLNFYSKYIVGSFAGLQREVEILDFFSPSGTQWPPVYYLRVLFSQSISVLFGAPLLGMSVIAFVKRGRTLPTPGIMHICLWIASSYFFVSLSTNLSSLYLLAALPPLAILLELLAHKLNIQSAFRTYSTLPIIGLGCYFLFSLPPFEIANTLRWVYRDPAGAHSINPDWKIGEILETVGRRAKSANPHIGIAGSHPFFSSNSFRFEIVRRGLNYPVIDVEMNQDNFIRELLLKSDFVITKTGDQFPSTASVPPSQLQKFFDGRFLRYQKIPILFLLPDKSQALLFQHLPNSRLLQSPDQRPYSGQTVISASGDFLGGLIKRQVSAVFADKIELMGMQIDRHDGRWFAYYFWHILEKLDREYGAFVHFLDEKGTIIKQGDYLMGDEFTTKKWDPGDFVVDGRYLGADLPLDGITTIGVGIWTPATKSDSLKTSISTLPTDWNTTRVLLPMRLAGLIPPREILPPTGREKLQKEVNFGDLFILASCAIDDNPESPSLWLVWRCIGLPSADYLFYVHFTDANGKIVFQANHQLLGGVMPAIGCRPGEWISERYRLRPPPGTDLSSLDVRLGVRIQATPPSHLKILANQCESDWGGVRLVLRANTK